MQNKFNLNLFKFYYLSFEHCLIGLQWPSLFLLSKKKDD